MKQTKELKGINGWLLIPTITLFALIGLIIIILLGTIYLLLIGEKLSFYELKYSLAFTPLLVLGIYCLFLEFKKRKDFIKWTIRLLWLGLIITIILSIIEKDYAGFIPTIIGTIIWIEYFKKSKRVKNTFIN